MKKFRMKKAQIEGALNLLNWRYGRGDIIAINVKRRTFVRVPFQCRPEFRSFKIEGNTVFACGHQLTVKQVRRKMTPAVTT